MDSEEKDNNLKLDGSNSRVTLSTSTEPIKNRDSDSAPRHGLRGKAWARNLRIWSDSWLVLKWLVTPWNRLKVKTTFSRSHGLDPKVRALNLLVLPAGCATWVFRMGKILMLDFEWSYPLRSINHFFIVGNHWISLEMVGKKLGHEKKKLSVVDSLSGKCFFFPPWNDGEGTNSMHLLASEVLGGWKKHIAVFHDSGDQIPLRNLLSRDEGSSGICTPHWSPQGWKKIAILVLSTKKTVWREGCQQTYVVWSVTIEEILNHYQFGDGWSWSCVIACWVGTATLAALMTIKKRSAKWTQTLIGGEKSVERNGSVIGTAEESGLRHTWSRVIEFLGFGFFFFSWVIGFRACIGFVTEFGCCSLSRRRLGTVSKRYFWEEKSRA